MSDQQPHALEELRVFRRFNDQEPAEAFMERIQALGFAPQLVVDQPVVDSLWVGDRTVWFLVKLPGPSFDAAEAALLASMEGEGGEVPADHYLHGFGDDELMDILVRPDEWSTEDADLARRLLRERGKPVATTTIEALRKARVDDLREEAPPQTVFIIVGYVSALFGGVIGIALGRYINTAKRTLSNGERVSVYRREDRRHRARIFFLGLITFTIWGGWRLWRLYQA